MFLTKLLQAVNVVNNLVRAQLCIKPEAGYLLLQLKVPMLFVIFFSFFFFVFSPKSAHHLMKSRRQNEI